MGDQYADQIVEIATYTLGPNGSPLMHTPKRFGMDNNGNDGAQPFLGSDGKKIAIKGSVQFRNTGEAGAYRTGVDDCEYGLWNFFCEDEGINDNGAQNKPRVDADSHLRCFSNLFYISASDLGSATETSLGKPRVVWADVRAEEFATMTACICNGDFNGSYTLSDICAKKVGTETMSTKMTITNASSSLDHACYIEKNLAQCILDLQFAQDGYISHNENQLEMAIEQGKMAYEKAYELQREAENMIQDAECSLENRAHIQALLAVSAATALIC